MVQLRRLLVQRVSCGKIRFSEPCSNDTTSFSAFTVGGFQQAGAFITLGLSPQQAIIVIIVGHIFVSVTLNLLDPCSYLPKDGFPDQCHGMDWSEKSRAVPRSVEDDFRILVLVSVAAPCSS